MRSLKRENEASLGGATDRHIPETVGRRAAAIVCLRRMSGDFGRGVVKRDANFQNAAVGTIPISVTVKKT